MLDDQLWPRGDRSYIPLATLAGLSAAPALGMQSLQPSNTSASPKRGVAFKGQSGINVFWPWGGPLVADPSNPNTRYAPLDRVFGPLANGPWDQHITKQVYSQCADVGLDHFRIQCNPGPWMQALREGDQTYLEGLFQQFDKTIESSLRAGVGVIIDLYLTGYVRDDPLAVLNQTGGPSAALSREFRNYSATLEAFVRRYRNYDPAMVAFELFNEPPDPAQFSGDWAGHLQPLLYDVVRTNAPNHTVVCTGAFWSSIDQLCAIDPSGYDRNVLWTIHPLIPAPASQQGYVKSQYRYISGLRYPPRSSDRTIAIDNMRAAVGADSNLSDEEKAVMETALKSDLITYFDTPQDGAWVSRQFDLVTAWCNKHRLSASSVYVGEYGATRTNQGLPGVELSSYEGTSRRDRARYMRDLRQAVVSHGFRSAPDHLDTYDYGLTMGQNAEIGPWDPLMIAALSNKG